jgi:hypothetical protein
MKTIFTLLLLFSSILVNAQPDLFTSGNETLNSVSDQFYSQNKLNHSLKSNANAGHVFSGQRSSKPVNSGLDVTLIFDNGHITVNEKEGIYQWLDCNNNYAFVACRNQYYLPIGKGSYSVIVSKNGISDTSDCFEIKQSNALPLDNTNDAISVEPLRNNGIFIVSAYKKINEMIVIDVLGNVIQKIRPTELRTMVTLKDKANGIYFLNVELDGEQQVFKLIKE